MITFFKRVLQAPLCIPLSKSCGRPQRPPTLSFLCDLLSSHRTREVQPSPAHPGEQKGVQNLHRIDCAAYCWTSSYLLSFLSSARLSFLAFVLQSLGLGARDEVGWDHAKRRARRTRLSLSHGKDSPEWRKCALL